MSAAEALLVIFACVGIHREILSDQGTHFTFSLLSELHRLLGVKLILTTTFHPSGSKGIEKLLAAFRKVCLDKPRKRYRYPIPALFALKSKCYMDALFEVLTQC